MEIGRDVRFSPHGTGNERTFAATRRQCGPSHFLCVGKEFGKEARRIPLDSVAISCGGLAVEYAECCTATARSGTATTGRSRAAGARNATEVGTEAARNATTKAVRELILLPGRIQHCEHPSPRESGGLEGGCSIPSSSARPHLKLRILVTPA